MNDFTKSELEAIRDNLVVPECFNEKSILYEAYQKILDMIVNYSEIKPPKMASYCCQKCNEEWNKCGCKK